MEDATTVTIFMNESNNKIVLSRNVEFFETNLRKILMHIMQPKYFKFYSKS